MWYFGTGVLLKGYEGIRGQPYLFCHGFHAESSYVGDDDEKRKLAMSMSMVILLYLAGQVDV